jgi:hypothetical protein
MPATLQIPASQTPKSFGAASNPPRRDNRGTADGDSCHSIHRGAGLAAYGMLPVTLLRESCSPDAERLIRKLGRVPYVADPWLPVTTIGPLLVMAHHNPESRGSVGRAAVPDHPRAHHAGAVSKHAQGPGAAFRPDADLAVEHDGAACSRRCLPIWAWKALSTGCWKIIPTSRLRSPNSKAFTRRRKAKTDTPGITHFNVVQRNMGVALQHLVSGCRARLQRH